jgi:hypothetical protein
MAYTKSRLDSYINGEVSSLDELKQENLGFAYADDKKCEFRYI